jgi:hypothetical protein
VESAPQYYLFRMEGCYRTIRFYNNSKFLFFFNLYSLFCFRTISISDNILLWIEFCIKGSFKYDEKFKDQINCPTYHIINSAFNFTWNPSRTNANYSRIFIFRYRLQMIEIENNISPISSTTLGTGRTILPITLIFIRFSIYDIDKIKAA